MEETTLEAGARVADRYQIEAELGAGGMARIYRALDTHLGRPVALKVMHLAAASQASRFEREARTAASLRHPSVVAVHDFGALADGRPYLVLEFIAGRTLHASLATDGPLSPRAALDYLRPIVGALSEAHAAGIVHRDIKPENLMLQSAPGMAPLVRLLDFGIAAVDPMSSDERLTRTGAIFGTPAYMSPEQALGRSVTAAADVWAIGATLHTLIAGTPPFTAETPPEVLVAVIREAPTDLASDVPENVRALVSACLQKDPDARPVDGAALLAMWPTLTPPVAPVVTSAPPRPIKRLVLVVAAAMLLVGLLAFRLGRVDAPAPAKQDAPVATASDSPAAVATVEPAEAVDDPLVAVDQLLDDEQSKAALTWLEAHPKVGTTGRRLLLGGLAQLAENDVAAGIASVAAALPTDPTLAQDPRLVPALLGVMKHKSADGVVPLLGGPLIKQAESQLRELAGTARHRQRWRAVEAIEVAYPEDKSARFAALRRDLRAGGCELRRKAATALGKLGNPDAIPELRRADNRSFFDKMCMNGEIGRAIRALKK